MIVGVLFVATSVSFSTGKVAFGSLGFGLVVGSGAYFLGIRPGIQLSPSGIVVRNPIRTVSLPWDRVYDVKVADVVVVTNVDLRVTRCYVISGNMRSLKRVEDAVAEIRAQWEAAKAAESSSGKEFYGVKPASWVGLAILLTGIVMTITTLLGSLHR